MHCCLLVLYAAFWYYMLADSRPEDVSSFDSINEPTLSMPHDHDVEIFSTGGLDDLSSNSETLTDLAFNSELTASENDADTYNSETDKLFPTEDLSLDNDPLLQSSTACETDDSLTWVNDSAPQLQARADASCTPSEPKGNIDSIIELFQNPERFLRQKIPSTKAPVGHNDQLGQDDETFSFESFLNNRPVPFMFEEDAKKCPVEHFGLSSTPVCLDALKGSAIRNFESSFTLYDVEPCTFLFHPKFMTRFSAKQDCNQANRRSNCSFMLRGRRALVL